ncbi:hypothetical protein [Nocardia sp. NPDC057455]|uniref:hypothetical protein n=1 Tax=Nocardia sp. NPDC057455 TaxID=3346138 RepID=UPI00366F0DAD
MSSKKRTIAVSKVQPGDKITESGEYFEGEIVEAAPEWKCNQEGEWVEVRLVGGKTMDLESWDSKVTIIKA